MDQFTHDALLLIQYFPSLQVPRSEKRLNLFDIVNLALAIGLSNIPSLPYQSNGSLYSKEIKQLVGYGFPRDLTKIFYNILNSLANYYRTTPEVELLDFLRSVWSLLNKGSDIMSLYHLIYTNPSFTTIPWGKILLMGKTPELTARTIDAINDKLALALDVDYIQHMAKMLPTVEHTSSWITKLDDREVKILIDTYYKASGRMESLENIVKMPFFVNILSLPTYLLKYKAIFATEIYSNSLEGGLSPEQILTSPFIYLTHSTRLENLERLLASGKLIFNTDRKDQFPGIYLYPNLHLEENAYYNMRYAEIIFVFSLTLLKSRAWHISKDEDYGNISSLTWSCDTFPDYLTSHYVHGSTFGELIFHYPIPLDYVEEVVVQDKLVEKARMLIGDKFPVRSLSEFKMLPLVKRVKSLYTDSSFSDKSPNFCYSNLGGDYPIVLSKRNIESTLLNCGYERVTVDDLMATKSYKELIQIVRQTSGTGHSIQVNPPY